MLQKSQHAAFWLDATGLLHVSHGNFTGPGFVGVSFASASSGLPMSRFCQKPALLT